MGHVNFRSLGIKNFNSIAEMEFPISPGKHLIIGENRSSSSASSNGSGKSSLFEAMYFALYKRTIRDKDPSFDYKGDCITQVEFDRGDDKYRVVRYHKHPDRGNTVELYLNGDPVTHRKTSSTEEEILKLIGIPPDIFLFSTLVLQGMPINFSTLTPTVRKSLLEDMLGFQVWEEFKTKFSYRSKDLSNQLSTVNMSHSSKHSEMVGLFSKVETLKLVGEANTEQLKVELEQVNTALTAIAEQGRDLQSKLSSTLGTHTSINEVTSQLDALRSSYHQFRSRAQTLESALQHGVCPTCNQSYPESQMRASQQEIGWITDKLGSIQQLSKELEAVRTNYEALNRTLNELAATYRNKQQELATLTSKLNYQHPDLAPLEETLTALNAEVNDLFQQLEAMRGSIAACDYLHNLLLPSSQFRTKVLERYLNHINSIVSGVTPMLFDDVKLAVLVDDKGVGLELRILRGATEVAYKSLSGGERRRIDIVLVLAIQRFLQESTGFSTNLLVFDEIFDGLDRKGIESALNCIDVLFPEASCVYVITHNESIKSVFNSIVRVVKMEGRTYLEGTSNE